MVRMKYYDGYWFTVDSGDWMSVPLPGGGYALGVIARAARGGNLLGYFFGPRRPAVSTLSETAGLTAGDSVLVGFFGSQGLRDRTWTLLGRDPHWERDTWPVPVFVSRDPITGRDRLRYYGNDIGMDFREEWLPQGAIAKGPGDGIMGSGLAELKLDRILTGNASG
jgi:hypothetical protein